MIRSLKNDAFRYWEKRRIIYNLILFIAGWLAWTVSQEFSYHIDDAKPASISDPQVILSLIFLFIVVNLCYTFAYVIEFLMIAEDKIRWWPFPGRTLLLIIGCLLGFWVASNRVSYIEESNTGALEYHKY